ncbi:MAG: heavy-metal-associated domain-containing protein [Acidobacteria bacterium]|nr:heavy-metal-associated domain-containing protein [Acidobacteriota bacterium]
MEVALQRLDGVADVSISLQTNVVQITYQPAASFQPQGIREAVDQVGGRVAQLQIVARGHVEPAGSNQYFVAGKNRFLVTDSSSIPEGKLISITGTVDDSETPFKLRIAQTRPTN